jgi:CheY-like chemotaxis protein
MATVLVVDDRATNREIARVTLDHAGHQVLEAAGGARALEVARQVHPDVVVADVLMPGMDGYEFVHQLRADPSTAGIPVLLYTANYREHEVRSIAQACGVSGIVLKGRDPRELAEAVEGALSERPAPTRDEGLSAATWEHLRTVNTKLVEKVRALHESDERFRLMAEASPVGIVLGDTAGRASYVNPRLSEITGLPAGELLDTGWLCCLAPDRRDPALAALRGEAGHGGPGGADGAEPEAGRGQHRYRDQVSLPGVTQAWLNVLLQRAHDSEGTPNGFIGMIDDITTDVEAERRRHAAEQRHERAAREHLTQRLESLTRMAGGVAHDFNNMLNVILSFSDFATQGVTEASDSYLTESAAEAIVADTLQITRAGRRAAHLTRQLLTFGRREVVAPTVVDVNALVRDVRDLVAGTIGKHIGIHTRLDRRLRHVHADASQLTQVLLNLAVNARDSMPGGGTLLFETANADLPDPANGGGQRLAPGAYVCVTVTDTGCGMTPEVAEHAIEPFFTTKPRGQGSGLGLATSYGIVNQAGGDLTIESTVGHGTSIRLHLPATDLPLTPPRHHTTRPAGGGETILVAEDEDGVRDVVERILRKAGYQVLAGVNGQDALAVAERHEGPIHALLTDVLMPQLDGRQLADRFTADRPGTPVLFMSGYAAPIMTEQGILRQDVTVLSKPFTESELLNALRATLERHDAPVTP